MTAVCLVAWVFGGTTASVYVFAALAVPWSVRRLVRALAASRPSDWTLALKRAVLGPEN